MQTKKLKILFVGEASFISTGYAKYSKEIIKRLHETGKYHIAEFACGAYPNHPLDHTIQWRYYANNPSPNSKQMEAFKQSPANAWGEWRFDKVLLDFKPDIVFDIRDPWVFTYQTVSPLRRFFHHVIMPTVDSAPQRYEWISMFAEADAVFTYSDWALKVLEDQSFGAIKPIGTAPPAANIDIFRPHPNKEALKQQFGINPDSKIVGTVMRNQIRKLFPNLFRAFKMYLDKSGDENTFLYCHTSYPDNGWNIPNLLVEYKIFNKVLFTYSCAKCRLYEPHLFQGTKTMCPRCHENAFMLTNVGRGIQDEELSNIYNLFDVYVQYANAEGFGVPCLEAAYCGLPLMVTNYSAMESFVDNIHAVPIEPATLQRTVSEGADRAVPDDQDFVNKLEKLLNNPRQVLRIIGQKTRSAAVDYINWDKTAQKLMDYFDNMSLTGSQGKWDSEPIKQIRMPNPNTIPENIGNKELTDWLTYNVLNEQAFFGYRNFDFVRNLNAGILVGKAIKKFDKKDIIQIFERLVQKINTSEAIRCGLAQLPKEDFIEYAHMKEERHKK